MEHKDRRHLTQSKSGSAHHKERQNILATHEIVNRCVKSFDSLSGVFRYDALKHHAISYSCEHSPDYY